MELPLQTIVDYFGSNDICLGIVSKTGAERFQVQGVTSQTEKVTPKQVIATYGSAGKDSLQALAKTMNSIRETMNGIDLDLLYEDLKEQTESKGLHAICKDYFGNEDSVSLSAMARKLSEDTLRFKRMGFDFVPRTTEEIEEILRLRALRAEKAAARERSINWLQSLLSSSEPSSVPQEQETLVKQLTDYLMLGFNSEGIAILSTLQSKTPLRELIIKILHKVNRFPEGADEFLLANGIHAGFSPKTLEAAEHLVQYVPDATREDYSNRIVFSIDDEETRDIDDALSCVINDDGTISVGIYIADPASFIEKDSPLDEAAVERPLSMYLPTTTVPMFPEIISYNYASLVQNDIRPCLAFNATYDNEGELLDWSLASAQVKITRRLSYHEADELIANGSDDIARSLQALHHLSRKLLKIREEDGAVTLNRPDLKIRVRNNEIYISNENTDTPSHNLVSEFMILCNNLAARYALVNDIPVIYRAQEKPSEPVYSVRPYEPCFFDQQVRKMRRTHLSTYPAPHFGLGLDLYTQVSSPLRRYADLVIQRQLSAHLRKLPLPYRQEELFVILDNVDKTSAQNKSLQREADNYWVLEFIRRNRIGAIFNATVVRQEGSLTLAEIDELYARGIVFTRDRVKLGERIRVKIRESHPETARLLMDIME